MIRFLKTTLILFMFIAQSQALFAQNINPDKVNVAKLSDAQIQKAIDEMHKRGLSIDQAIMMARANGFSEAQIMQMKARMQALQRGGATSTVDNESDAEMTSSLQIPDYSTREVADLVVDRKKSRVFGFQFFNLENLSFSPSIDVPVSDSYTLGIGDELVVEVYGDSQQTYNLVVKNNGNAYIPDIGPVKIVGLPFPEVKEKIKTRLMSIYSGMKGQKPNTFVDVSVGQLRSVLVNVIGDVNVPGTYTLPATASVFNALYLAGGPDKNGSFRQIDLIRDGKIIANIDVYAYLIDGKTQENVQLRDQDVILVRPYQNRVIMSGEFKRQGWFEAKNGETVSDIIRFAGGFSDKAYTHSVSIYRNNTRTMSLKDVIAEEFDTELLMNGDSIVAGEIVSRFENMVQIEGAVYRPGNYEMTEGLMLSQLIARSEGVKEEAYMDRSVIIRKKKDFTFEILAFSLKDILNDKSDIALQKNDRIQISSIFDMREARTIEIVGEVQYPGTYDYAEGLKLADLIYMAGGFLEQAEVSAVEVSRILNKREIESLTKKLSHSFQFPVDRQLKMTDEDAAFTLNAFDKVYVRRAPGFRPQAVVKIQGEVIYAGDFGLTFKGEKISDIIKRAGGLTPEAFAEGASLRRKHKMSDTEYDAKLALAKQDSTLNEPDIKRTTEDDAKLASAKQDSTLNKPDIKRTYYKVVGIDLEKILENPGGVEDLLMKDGDQLLVPEQMQTVKVSGAVLSPVALTFKDNKSLKEYIRSSGGFAQSAKKSKVYVLYANGTSESTRGSIFGRRYPRVKPGCEIIVPKKPEVNKTARAGMWLGITSAIVSMFTAISIALK